MSRNKKISIKKYLLILFCIPIIYSGFHYIKLSTFSGTNKHPERTVIAHRGAGGEMPENTLAAVKQAMEDKSDYIEIDVHESKDGAICVMHDRTVNRTTNGKGKIKNLTWEEIQKLDAGSWFSPKFKNEKVPLLEQVIQAINGKCKLLIEIKKGDPYYPDIEEKVVRIIQKHNAQQWCAVQSFNMDVIEKIHRLDSSLELHKLEIFVLPSLNFAFDGLPHAFRPDENPYIKAYNVNCFFLSSGIIESIHQSNKKVNAWTCDSEAVINRMIDLKVDGIITNKPRNTIKLIK